ncbi:hypothetical protein RirG_143550 [Rhizophagus irregularis DAOM 197198w]|uniref:Uncharacterized protein n=1 Tax=Rhizophagus irregularis (strain DAOM 197198w) TaxID=1432141 RepID=A0A015MC11_RHIIW|nr:hypothetical protein RirG_143550 [Rhizophagus irregularis DAOM 197198w]
MKLLFHIGLRHLLMICFLNLLHAKVVPLLFRDPLPLRLYLNDVPLKDAFLMFRYQV